ncbi:unnamed protein product [Urochloa humidicola]
MRAYRCNIAHIVTNLTAVSIGPYHYGSPKLLGMEAAKTDALDKFCRAASLMPEVSQTREVARERILNLAETTVRSCYQIGDESLTSIDDSELSEIMLRDGCFLLQFMQKVGDDNILGMSRGDLMMDGRVSDIARDILLFENQIPWVVVQTLIELGKIDSKKVVGKFLSRMVNFFHVRSRATTTQSPIPRGRMGRSEKEEEDTRDVWLEEGEWEEEPPHLLAIFHRYHVGKASSQGQGYTLLSLGSSAVELAEMGVKLTAMKTKKLGDMEMKKRCWPLGLFGELSLAPLALNELTACWLLNMVAYEAFLGATQAGNFAISSYIFLVAHLINREEDVQDLRARGIISSAMSDGDTLNFFKSAAPSLRVGNRYIEITEKIQEYTQERWIWIAIHSFIYNNFKIIVTVLSVVGVLAGLFKTIMSLKQPQQS